MARTEWIESADTHGRASQSSGPKTSFSTYGDHLLVMAAQDRADAAAERVAAARAVHRIAGDGAPEILDMLGLTAADGPAPVEPAERRKRCAACETSKPIDEFGRNPARSDGCTTYCKPCTAERRRAERRKAAR